MDNLTELWFIWCTYCLEFAAQLSHTPGVHCLILLRVLLRAQNPSSSGNSSVGLVAPNDDDLRGSEFMYALSMACLLYFLDSGYMWLAYAPLSPWAL